MPRVAFRLFITAACAALMAGFGWAQPVVQNAPSDPAARLALTAEEQAWIAAHAVVVVGHDPSYAPYVMFGPDGRLQGLDIDYLDLIAQRTGLKFENRAYKDWNLAMADFKAGKFDLATSLGRTDERENYMIFTQAYTVAPNVIVTRTDTPYLISTRELRGWRVGVARGYEGLITILRQEAPGCIIVELDSMELALKAVAEGAVDAAISDLVNASYAIRSLHLANLRLGSVIPGSGEIHIGVRKDSPILAQIIDKAVQDITLLERKVINDRWIGLDVEPPGRWGRTYIIAAGLAGAGVLAAILFFFQRRLGREQAERQRVQRQLAEARSQLTELQRSLELLAETIGPATHPSLGSLEKMRAAHRQLSRTVNDLLNPPTA